MKPNPLIRQLTDSALPASGPVASAQVRRVVEAKKKKPEPAQTDSDLKDDVFSAYQDDWRYTAIDQFNAAESEGVALTDDESLWKEDKGENADFMRFGDWHIYRDDDTAERYAYNQVLQDLKDEPEIFNQEWLSNFIDEENLKHLLWQDVAEHRRSDFDEMRQKEKIGELERAGLIDADTDIYTTTKAISRDYRYPAKKQKEAIAAYVEQSRQGLVDPVSSEDLDAMDDEDLVKLLVAAHIVDEDDAYTEDQVEREDLDEFLDSKADDYVESLEKDFDPMEWLRDIYGKEDALKQAIEIAGLDAERAAKEAISTDGWAHFLAVGADTSSLDCGAVYFEL